LRILEVSITADCEHGSGSGNSSLVFSTLSGAEAAAVGLETSFPDCVAGDGCVGLAFASSAQDLGGVGGKDRESGVFRRSGPPSVVVSPAFTVCAKVLES
jgi:hypothetical protein